MASKIAVNKRLYVGAGLKTDSSQRLLTQYEELDWSHTLKIVKGIRNMPLLKNYKEQLIDWAYEGSFAHVYEFYNPLVYIYRFPSGEMRWFLVSANGNLIESPKQQIWDIAFPFLTFNSDATSGGASCESAAIEVEAMDSLIWLPESNNYTHFFFDSFAPAAFADLLLRISGFETKTLTYIYEHKSEWQKEFLDKLSFKGIRLKFDASSDIALIRPKSVIFPVVSQKSLALKFLREFIKLNMEQGANIALKDSPNLKILFLTRCDYRRSRIQNIDEIEKFVVQDGGTVIDPSTLSFEQKRKIIQLHGIVIAQSSGCINFALFCEPHHHLINLVEKSSIIKPEFVQGGWDYTASYAFNNVRHVIGVDYKELPGSPVGSASFPLNQIVKTVENIRFSVNKVINA